MTPEERKRLAELLAIESRSEDEETEFRTLVAKAAAEQADEEGEDEGRDALGAMTPEALARVIGDTVGTSVREALKPLEELRQEARPYGGAARTEPSWADRRRYSRLIAQNPGLEGIRTPENDLVVSEWVQRAIARDRGGIERMAREHADLFAESRAFATTTALSAGNLVPDPLAMSIVVERENMAVVGPRSQSNTNPAGRLSIPSEGVKVAVAAHAENAAESAGTDPTFPDLDLATKTALGIFVSSRENDEDSAFSLVSILSRQAGEAFAAYNDAEDINGSTNTNPILAATGVAEIATVGTITEADITDAFFTIKAGWRRDAVWLMNSTNMQRLTNLQWANGNGQVLVPGGGLEALSGTQGGGTVGTILGRPVLEPAGGAVDGSIIFGSLAGGFAELTKGGMMVEATTEGFGAFEAHQIRWKFVQRRDSGVTKASAFVKLTGITG